MTKAEKSSSFVGQDRLHRSQVMTKSVFAPTSQLVRRDSHFIGGHSEARYVRRYQEEEGGEAEKSRRENIRYAQDSVYGWKRHADKDTDLILDLRREDEIPSRKRGATSRRLRQEREKGEVSRRANVGYAQEQVYGYHSRFL